MVTQTKGPRDLHKVGDGAGAFAVLLARTVRTRQDCTDYLISWTSERGYERDATIQPMNIKVP